MKAVRALYDRIAENHPERKPRFDGTINLGHILTAVVMGAGLVTMWANAKVITADHESRLKTLEQAQVEFKQGLSKLAENESMALRTQDKLANTMDWLMKERDRKEQGK